jgi:hypothetical protein
MTSSVSSFRIMKGFFFPSLLFLIFSSAAAVPEEGVTTALAADAAVVGRAASSVGSMAVKPSMLIMLVNVGVMLADVSKGFFLGPLLC